MGREKKGDRGKIKDSQFDKKEKNNMTKVSRHNS